MAPQAQGLLGSHWRNVGLGLSSDHIPDSGVENAHRACGYETPVSSVLPGLPSVG